MPIKRLTYPAYPASDSDDRGVNTRLSEAHVHANALTLAELTDTDIEAIRKSLDVDWTNLSRTAIDKLYELNNLGGYVTKPESIDGVGFVYTSEGWQDVSDIDIASLSSTDGKLVVNKLINNQFTIQLSTEASANIDAVTNKVDKLIGVEGNVISFGSAGSLRDSGVNMANVELIQNRSSSISSDSETTYATSKAVKRVNDRLTAAIEGIGKLRGVVYNAFSAQGSNYVLSDIQVAKGGYGYKEGDQFCVVGEVDAILSAHVNEEGEVLSFDIINGGMFHEEYSDLSIYPKSTSSTLLEGMQVIVSNPSYVYSSNTTLRDIDNPLLGDTCYVNFDELHDSERSLYTYIAVNEVTNGWVHTACVNASINVKACSYVS